MKAPSADGTAATYVVAREMDPTTQRVVDRRTVLGSTGASIFAGILGIDAPADPRSRLIAAVLGGEASGERVEASLETLTQRVTTAKRSHQSCAYTDLLTTLPPLLGALASATDRLR